MLGDKPKPIWEDADGEVYFEADGTRVDIDTKPKGRSALDLMVKNGQARLV